jgi:hypothetical protein
MTHTLSFSEVDEIVCRNLDCLDQQKYQVVREARGHSILYTITREGAFLGRYAVSKRPDGGVDYGSIQGDGAEWDVIWKSMLFTAIKRAEGNQSQEEGYLPLNWRELSRRIDVLNRTQGLGMVKETVQGPGTNGTTGWFTPGNGVIFIHGQNDLSFIEYRTLDEKPAMPETLEIWRQLREWLAMEQPTGAAVDGGQGERVKKRKSKRGPHQYSKDEKIRAVTEWDDLDKDKYPTTLEEWLEQKFGEEHGVLCVKPSAFHGWRKLKNS